VSESEPTVVLDSNGGAASAAATAPAPLPPVVPPLPPVSTAEPVATAEPPASVPQQPVTGPEASKPKVVAASSPDTLAIRTFDPAVAMLCAPLSETDPCGPDLDVEGDGDYLNFFASAENILPRSFFSPEDGRPFDRATIDLPGQLDAMKPLLERTRDLRLLILRARLFVLNRDLGGFAVVLAAITEWLEKFWDAIHPRPQDGDLDARAATVSALDLPTVVFPLQYTPLFDGGRIGAVTYRMWMIASGEVKPRQGEQKHSTSTLTEAMADTDPAALAASRKHVAMLKASLGRIRNAFMLKGTSAGLQNLPALVDKISAFIDPLAAAQATPEAEAGAPAKDGATVKPAGAAPISLTQARDALAAIAEYYSRMEPSSPTLPLVRQAHQLIGKSFIEVMTILVPTQMEKAAFQIGAEQVFELPLGRLSKLPEMAPAPPPADGAGRPDGTGAPQYAVESRSQAIALLDQVQRFFRASEPASPVPMLCDRARALAERDFMGVLRDVLPKAALKNAGVDK
jgi:type VI secretion system protein ImpA